MCLIWLVSYFEVLSNMASVFNTFNKTNMSFISPLPPRFFCHFLHDNTLPKYKNVSWNDFIVTTFGVHHGKDFLLKF